MSEKVVETAPETKPVRRFFKQIVQIEILSENTPWNGSIETLANDVVWGDCVGRLRIKKTIELTGKEAADSLYECGSEPGFFLLDDEGASVDENDDDEDDEEPVEGHCPVCGCDLHGGKCPENCAQPAE